MEETIKPSRGRVNRRVQNIFQDIRQQDEQPQISILPEAQSFDGLPPSTPDYMSLTQFNQEFMKLENGVSDSQHMNNRDFKYGHRATSSFDSTMSNMTNLDSAFDEEFDGTDLESITSQQLNSGTHTPAGNMSPHRHGHSHRRNQSTASLVSNASIASLNIDSTRQATGVTPQDIDKYIQMPLGAQDGDKDGPATDNAHKYKCLYPGCKNIYYGRKENIKSHIQTHLNDRQYKCPNCPKCFVRQHDLKRHAKIHTGVKPYHCDCGNGFARHDALTRHRQRGMCIGALENLPERKKNKRGRPRKNPHAGESTGTSSPEGPSDSSAAATPVLAATPAFDFNNPDHVMERNANILMMNMPIQSTAPMTAAPTSPMFMGSQSSPLLMPAQSYVSPEEIMSSHPTTPRDAHQATSPPDLVHSTSPALSGFDLDNSATMPDLSGLPSGSMDNMNLTMPVNVDNPDEAMMFAFIEDYSVHEQYVDNTPKFNDGGIDDILSDNPFY